MEGLTIMLTMMAAQSMAPDLNVDQKWSFGRIILDRKLIAGRGVETPAKLQLAGVSTRLPLDASADV